MKHLGTVTLETDRLILRRFTLEDSENMFNNWANSSEVTRFLAWEPHKSVKDTEEVLQKWVEAYNNLGYYQWAIVLKDIEEPIGSITVVSKDELFGTYEVDYCIGEKWWGCGITAEALSEVIRFLFDCVGIFRVTAFHELDNPNSGRVMQKCGMEYKGIERYRDGTRDMSMYYIINEVEVR